MMLFIALLVHALFVTVRRSKQLKTGRLNVVAHLNQLPNTQHDLNSLTVDVCHMSVSTTRVAIWI